MSTTAVAGNEMKLSVHYSGADVDRGRMSAVDLGPAILGLGEMIGETSRILYGDSARVRVEVSANFERASFGIEFLAVAPVAGLIGALTMGDLANIATILGFVGSTTFATTKGLLAILRWQRRRKIDSTERIGDQVRITIQDESRNVTINEYNVFINPVRVSPRSS